MSLENTISGNQEALLLDDRIKLRLLSSWVLSVLVFFLKKKKKKCKAKTKKIKIQRDGEGGGATSQKSIRGVKSQDGDGIDDYSSG